MIRVLVFALVAVACGLAPSPALADGYLGDFCWQLDFADGGTGTAKLGVSYFGGSHYQLAGTATGAGFDGLVQGTAEVGASTVKLLLNITGDEPFGGATSASSALCTLNPSSLSGTCKEVGVWAASIGPESSGTFGVDTFSATNSSCPGE